MADVFVKSVYDYSSRYGFRTAFSIALCFLMYHAATRLAKKHCDERTCEAAGLKVVGTLHAILVSPIAAYALFYEQNTAPLTYACLKMNADSIVSTSLYSGSSQTAEFLIPISIAFFLFELCLYRKWHDGGVAMVIHHVGSVFLWPLSLERQVGHWHLLVFLAYELSTPFLHARWFLRRFGSDWKQLYDVNNVIFALVFIIVRNFTAPMLVYSLYKTAQFSGNDVLFRILHTAGFVPLGLNTYWGYKVLKIGLGKKNKAA